MVLSLTLLFSLEIFLMIRQTEVERWLISGRWSEMGGVGAESDSKSNQITFICFSS